LSQFAGTSTGALGEASFGQSLQAPSDTPGQPGLVSGAQRLAKDLSVPLAQLRHAEALKSGYLPV
jgi:hypothetical protein